MRTFFRVINGILLTAALLAAAYCGYHVYSVRTFPTESYDAREADIRARTDKTLADAERARQDADERLAFLKADLKNNGEEAVALSESMEETRAEQESKARRLAELQEMVRIREDLPASVEEARSQYADRIRELEEKIRNGETEVRICYWTLDDGPTYITKNFLDALDEMDGRVRVTFFTANGANDSPDEEEILRREMTSGHSVQNHSYAHVTNADGPVYRSPDSFREQILLQDEWLLEVTGFHPTIFRFPGGSAWGRDLVPGATDVIAELGYEWVDWNCNLYDAGAADKLPSAALETSRAVTQISEEPIAMILGHDWNSNTLIAMKNAIPMLQEKGYVFLPLFPESVTMGLVAAR
ncbi:MAG: polysaccharide deacetylase family protein [Oscillospiraceae bacterium]|nr:polysaccharide deacetylase family protein [Oscillospiraceae bacterium]